VTDEGKPRAKKKPRRRRRKRTVQPVEETAAETAAEPEQEPVEDSGTGPEAFAALGLSDKALAAVRRIGFVEPTEIQAEFIPAALTGRDCVGRARTGTGKTAAFLLPIFEHFFRGEKIRALVLAPTRELAAQITEECREFSGHGRPRSVALCGGTPIGPQISRLKKDPEIIIATPGRLLDHAERHTVDLSSCSIVVLDEVDRMFDMGFRKDIWNVLRKCMNRKQTLFLSATMPEDIMRLAEKSLIDPVRITALDEDRPSVETLDQRSLSVIPQRKLALLLEVLKREQPELCLVFTRTKRGAERLGKRLQEKGLNSGYIHGDLPQHKRNRAIAHFRERKIRVLVATDVMGRGIDVTGISHVINYDIPENPQDYLHRVGRSSRMNAPGTAITFVTPEQGGELTGIEMICNRLLETTRLDDFDSGV